jgi:hypothetical protein
LPAGNVERLTDVDARFHSSTAKLADNLPGGIKRYAPNLCSNIESGHALRTRLRHVSAEANTAAALSLKALDQAGFYQQPVETPGLDATRAAVEKAAAAFQDPLLLGKCRIKRNSGRFLYH